MRDKIPEMLYLIISPNRKIILAFALCAIIVALSIGYIIFGSPPAWAEKEDGSVDSPAGNEVPPATGWVDNAYKTTVSVLQGSADRLDRFFAGEVENEITPSRSSRFELRFNVLAKEDDGVDVSTDVDFKADVELPRTAKRFRLFLTSSLPHELPGEDPNTTKNALLVGLHRTLDLRRLPYLNFRLGVKARTPPVVVAAVRLGHGFKPGGWDIVPRWRGFWLSDDGFGEVQSLRIDRWMKEKFLLRSGSAARWTEQSDGVEWEQSLLLALTRKGTFRNLDRGIGVRAQVFGHKSGTGVVDKYKLGIIYRFPVWRSWLYISMGPEVSWENENDWGSVPAFRFGMDALLWSREELSE